MRNRFEVIYEVIYIVLLEVGKPNSMAGLAMLIQITLGAYLYLPLLQVSRRP